MKSFLLVMFITGSVWASDVHDVPLKYVDFQFATLPMNVVLQCEYEFNDSVLVTLNKKLWDQLDRKEKKLEVKNCINKLYE